MKRIVASVFTVIFVSAVLCSCSSSETKTESKSEVSTKSSFVAPVTMPEETIDPNATVMPDLYGKDLDAAKAAVSAIGFEYEVRESTSLSVDSGKVITTVPKAGAALKEKIVDEDTEEILQEKDVVTIFVSVGSEKK